MTMMMRTMMIMTMRRITMMTIIIKVMKMMPKQYSPFSTMELTPFLGPEKDTS